MLLSVSSKLVPFTSSPDTHQKSNREKVENAAAVTGGVGAGTAAASRGGAMKFFKTSATKVSSMSNTAYRSTQAIEGPVKQTNSLWNAFKLNKTRFFNQIKTWAESSKMPRFMKGLFTGKLGSFVGGGAAIFVFIMGIGEVINTASNNIYRLGASVSFDNNN